MTRRQTVNMYSSDIAKTYTDASEMKTKHYILK